KQEILHAFVRVFKKINESTFMHVGVRKKALRLYESANETFQRREILDFFEDIDHEFDVKQNNRELHKNVETAKVLIAKKATTRIEEALEIQQINKKRKMEENIDVVHTSGRNDNIHEVTAVFNESNDEQSVKDYYKTPGPANERGMTNPFFSDDEQLMIQHYKEAKKSKLPFWNKRNILPDEELIISPSGSLKTWILPSGQNVGNIYANKISENAKVSKKKKKLTAVERSIFRYVEFSVRAVATKTIGDRCRSARINQSILNGLLEYNLNDEQAKDIHVPFLQFGGTSGQLLIEDIVEGFYIVFPGPKFELPTKLRDIKKLKTSINVIKMVIDMYKKIFETIENLETTRHEFDDIFSEDGIVDTTKPTHYKYKYIHKPWWTPK
ncbi:3883_t:CDS:2, partial [Diversispora eburnea]